MSLANKNKTNSNVTIENKTPCNNYPNHTALSLIRTLFTIFSTQPANPTLPHLQPIYLNSLTSITTTPDEVKLLHTLRSLLCGTSQV